MSKMTIHEMLTGKDSKVFLDYERLFCLLAVTLWLASYPFFTLPTPGVGLLVDVGISVFLFAIFSLIFLFAPTLWNGLFIKLLRRKHTEPVRPQKSTKAFIGLMYIGLFHMFVIGVLSRALAQSPEVAQLITSLQPYLSFLTAKAGDVPYTLQLQIYLLIQLLYLPLTVYLMYWTLSPWFTDYRVFSISPLATLETTEEKDKRLFFKGLSCLIILFLSIAGIFFTWKIALVFPGNIANDPMHNYHTFSPNITGLSVATWFKRFGTCDLVIPLLYVLVIRLFHDWYQFFTIKRMEKTRPTNSI